MKRSLLMLVAVAVSATALSASVKFTSTWKSMDAGTVSFAGTSRTAPRRGGSRMASVAAAPRIGTGFERAPGGGAGRRSRALAVRGASGAWHRDG